MLKIPDNVRQDIIRLVPSSAINEISCFVHYDNHPRDSKCIDITVCTKSGELKEFYQRELVAEAYLDCNSPPTEIKILRNSKCELFYIVLAGDTLIIVSRRDKLYIHRKERNVERYDVSDAPCLGQACLQIIRKDDAVPLIFDDKFESLGDRASLLSNIQNEETLPILTDLNRKLVEAKYSVKCNENTYKEFLNLRQLAAYSVYQKSHPNLDESAFKSGQMAGALNIKNQTPWVKMCNNKIVIVLNLINNNEKSLEDVHILLHAKKRHTMVYTTKILKKITKPPFWEVKHSNIINDHQENAVVAVVDLKEIKENVLSRLEFSGVLVYKIVNTEHMLPFESVSVSAMDCMGEEFDVLSNHKLDEHQTVLAVLATTDKTDLIIRHIKNNMNSPEVLNMPAVFCKYLNMTLVQNTENVLIHRHSPYHPLNGVMLVFNDACSTRSNQEFSIHARSPSQVLAFIHYIHDAVPYNLIITSTNHILISKTEQFSQYNEDISHNVTPTTDYVGYASAMLNQSTLLMEHLDLCMVKMNESKIAEVQEKLGSEIDLFAAGVSTYAELKRKMQDEEIKGLKLMRSSNASVETIFDGMAVERES